MTRRVKVGFVVLGLLIAAGFAAWLYQLKTGLVVTNMRNSYSWGLYVSGLAFFVGNAAGGLVLTSMIYLFGVTQLKPFAKIGALTAFANVTAAMISILPDIGQPIRLYNMLLHPQMRSPLIWDIIILNLYALLSLLYLYLLMLPDLKGPLQKIAIKVDDPKSFSETWAKRLAPFSLVAAVGIHVITAWVFSTQGSREWWHSAALAPDFVAAALVSGTACVLLVALMTYGFKEEFKSAYRTLAVFISIAFFIHFFLMYNEFLIHFWYGAEEALDTLGITFKDYGSLHAFEILAPLVAVILLLNEKVRENPAILAACTCLLMAGIFVHRVLLMPGAFAEVPLTIHPLGAPDIEWSAPIASGFYTETGDVFLTKWRYFPSFIEIAIFVGAVAYMSFVILLGIRKLPIVQRNLYGTSTV